MINNELLQCKAKRVDTGEWIVGYYCKEIVCFADGTKAVDSIQEIKSDYEAILHRIDPSTLCRCTGLRDKNGTLIWERDVVKYASFTYIVRNGSYNINPKNCAPAHQCGLYLEILSAPMAKEYIGYAEPIYDIDGFAARFPAHCMDSEEGIESLKLVIIGNAVDNPELLEDGAE